MFCATVVESEPVMPPCVAPTLRLEAVHAAAQPDTTHDFFLRKQACYARFGSQAASVPSRSATQLRHLHLIVAREASGSAVGGVAIYRRAPDAPLPLETAIGAHHAVACTLARWNDEGSLVELSGLWSDESWRKSGLSRALMLAAMASCHNLGAARVLGFSHQHVLGFYGTVGLQPYLDIGTFHYPDARYVSTVVSGDPVRFGTVPETAMPELQRYRATLAGGAAIDWSAPVALAASA